MSENLLEAPAPALAPPETPYRRMLGRFGVGCAVALSALSLAAGRAPEAQADTSGTGNVPHCVLPTQTVTEQKDAHRDRIHVVGNREVDGWNRTWIPYGISVYGGLQDGDGNAAWQPTIGQSMAQIKAAPFWHANTVRLQWAEANIFRDLAPGDNVNVSFLQALCDQVRQIRSQGEVVVLNDNTEFPDWGEFNPEARTEDAWKTMYEEFGNQPGLIYEPFNEPRLKLSDAGRKRTPANLNWLWHIWRDGGQVYSKQFIGMQGLVNYLRGIGYKNEIWLDPPMLEGLREYGKFPIKDPRHDVVPTFHHGGLPIAAAHGDTSGWYNSFGYLTKRYPVVDGEWNQAAAPTSECNPNAYYVVPIYLRYLFKHHIGLIAWSLQEGSMVAEGPGHHRIATNVTKPYETTDPRFLMRPSHMNSSYACDTRHVGQGAGQQVLNDFRAHSRP